MKQELGIPKLFVCPFFQKSSKQAMTLNTPEFTTTSLLFNLGFDVRDIFHIYQKNVTTHDVKLLIRNAAVHLTSGVKGTMLSNSESQSGST